MTCLRAMSASVANRQERATQARASLLSIAHKQKFTKNQKIAAADHRHFYALFDRR
jgi:hypothetical protein